ncbi:hypothetical protein, partial [Escherichia coli]|uniref:hypothetical protein n=1 Tax=Escherichia coli TaxID=562 RepID=UPI001BDCBA26
ATLEGQFLGNLRSAIASYHWNNEKVRCLIAPGKNRRKAVFSGSDETSHLLIVPMVTGYRRAQIT